MDPITAFLLQMSMLLVAARTCGEICRRLNQPPVLGELLAGILLGPSAFGALFPNAFQSIFSNTTMLQSMSTMGLVLLMLLTGLETDVRVLRNMGRAALGASISGMLIPFASGFLLALYVDDRFVTNPATGRFPLALFLATAMGVSAMPVLAKILMDLNLMRRNFAIIALSAAVVDDVIGWILLAVLSGIATTGIVNSTQIVETVFFLILFVALARYALFPAVQRILPKLEHEMRMPNGELVIVLVITMLCGAATEAIHVHAVFGAFVAGAMLRQCPTLRPENLHKLEAITLTLFAPIFFGAVGLRVDLWQLNNLWLMLAVLGIAIGGKIIGCLIGGLLGRMPFWEALAVGCCMSARGAVELVVAKIGLDLKVITPEMFSIIVVMAVATSFLAPLMVRKILPRIPASDEEQMRGKSAAGGFLPVGQLRLLVPVGGGENALVGVHMASHLCHTDGDRCTALYVDRESPGFWKRLTGHAKTEFDLIAYFQRLKLAAGTFAGRLSIRQTASQGDVVQTLLSEAGKGYHALVVGASGERHPVYDPFISNLVTNAPCHVVVVAGPRGTRQATSESTRSALPRFKRILVPTNGSYYSDAAFEIAAMYAASSGAHVNVLYVSERHARNPLLPAASPDEVTEHMQDLMRTTLRQQFKERASDPTRIDCLVRESDSILTGLLEEARDGDYDLVVLGAENKSFVERLYLGQHIEAAITEVPCATIIVIPRVTVRR